MQISEGYHHRKRIEEYKSAHGGKLPPDPLLTRIGKTLMPCLYVQKVHIKISGASMKDL